MEPSRFQIFRNIVIPLIAPGLVVAALFTFIFAWNDFAYAVIFSGSKVTPLPVVIGAVCRRSRNPLGPNLGRSHYCDRPCPRARNFTSKIPDPGLTMGAIK